MTSVIFEINDKMAMMMAVMVMGEYGSFVQSDECFFCLVVLFLGIFCFLIFDFFFWFWFCF